VKNWLNCFTIIVIFALPALARGEQNFQYGPPVRVEMLPAFGLISEFTAPDWLEHSFRIPFYSDTGPAGMVSTPRPKSEHPDGRAFIFAKSFVRSPDGSDWKAASLNKIGKSYIVQLVSYIDPASGASLVITPIKMQNDPDRDWYVFRWASNGFTPDQRMLFGYRDKMKSVFHSQKERQKYLQKKYLKKNN
jgi:hypothetical protein